MVRARFRRTATLATAVLGMTVPALSASVAHADAAGVHLVVSTLPTSAPEPGGTYDKSVTITNTGTETAHGVLFQVRLTRGLGFTDSTEGCTYTTDADQVGQARCGLDTVVEPGASVTVPVRFKVLAKGLMESVEYGTGPTGEAPGKEGYGDSYHRMPLTVDSSADLVAVGDRAKGRRGHTVTVTAALRNDGPGWIHNTQSDDQPGLMVHVPAGTTAVQVPRECAPFGIDSPTGPSEPGHPVYVCWHDDNLIEVGQTLSYTFVLKIGGKAHDTEGEVRASSVYGTHQDYDKNAANDTATLHVDVAEDDGPGTGGSGGTTSGGGAGDGGTGTGTGTGAGTGGPHNTHAPSTGGSHTLTGSTSPAPTDSPTGDPSGTSPQGNLAATGGNGTAELAGSAAATFLAGGSVVLLARRRRNARTRTR
ncbi:hypothetical protein [Streptomyces sp. NPDC088358]|uniref:hypothetical protein n=1 Tax=Streptomyces sp. NPDC088358 TaxID=3365857 RepID=UPI0038050DAE